MNRRHVELIVTDASPLITLARAGALDLLLALGVPVSIPDAVYVECTRRAFRDSDEIVSWANSTDAVSIALTRAGIDQLVLMDAGRPARNFGEYAAIEVLDVYLERHAEALAVLLYEDADIEKRRPSLGDRIKLVTTGTLLAELEFAGHIQSADHVLDAAAATGRNVEGLRAAPEDADLRAVIERGERGGRASRR